MRDFFENDFVRTYLPLIIALVGSVTTVLMTNRATRKNAEAQGRRDAEERSKQRDHDTDERLKQRDHSIADRQEERLSTAIVEFATSLKQQTRIYAMVAAHLGVDLWSREKVSPEAAEVQLERHESERSGHFERILLLADIELQQRARHWQNAVWDLSCIKTQVRRPSVVDFCALMNESAECRDRFYNVARARVGIKDHVDPTPKNDCSELGRYDASGGWPNR